MKTTQNKSTFTPSKWEIGEDGDVFSEGACIALVCGAPEGIQEAKANAKLIAAAPDLLDACKNLWGDLKEEHQDEIDNNHNGDDPADCSYCDDLKAAEAAIAKAEQG